MLGTCTETSIYHEHVLQKAKKEIAKANRLGAKIQKNLEKYKGSELPDDKIVQELQGVMRSFLQALGKPLEVPDTVDELLEKNIELDEEFQEKLKKMEQVKATVFMKDNEGWPMISTHMILGNLKENLKVMVNNGDKSIIRSKVAVGETMALDVKPVDGFMKPNTDILRAKTQEEVDVMPVADKGRNTLDLNTGRVLLERPIRFERMGKTETAIALSEQLPAGTEFETVLRVRDNSPIDIEALHKLFDLGKSNGFGSWRGSGNMGAYFFRIEGLPEYKEETPDGWN